MKIALTLSLLCFLTVICQAQVAEDNGSVNAVFPRAYAPSALTPGSLTTIFTSNHGYGGNMFDITPNMDLKITGLDINVDVAGSFAAIDVYYRVGTSVGYEYDATAWTLLVSGSGVSAGLDLPSFIDVSGNGLVFKAHQIYGIYVDLTSYPIQNLRYTNGGPNTYSNAELSLVTNSANGSPAFSTAFFPRIWNGTIYYDTHGGPTLTISDLYGGQVGTFTLTGGTPNTRAYLAYSLAGLGSTYVPFLNVILDIAKPEKAGPPVTTNPHGSAVWNLRIPPAASGRTVWFQAVQHALKTNVVRKTIL